MQMMPGRPAAGDLGRALSVVPNCRRVRLKAKKIHIYTLEFEPPIPEDATARRQEVIYKQFSRDLQRVYGIWFPDNLRMYSPYLVEGDARKFKSSEFSLEVRHVRSIDVDASEIREEVLQIETVMLKKGLFDAGYARSGRRYFDKVCDMGDEYVLKGRNFPDIVIWPGWFMALENVACGQILKLDTSHRVLHRHSIRNLIDDTERTVAQRLYGDPRNLTDDEWANVRESASGEIRDELKGAAVITMYNKRVYRIDEYLPNMDPHTETFRWKQQDEDITYARYTEETYKVRCEARRPGMLLHIVKKGKRRGDEVFLIPEFCHLTGLTRKMKEHRDFMRAFAKRTAEDPRQRFEKMDDAVKRIRKAVKKHKSNVQGEEFEGANIAALGDVGDKLERFELPLKIDKENLHVSARNIDVKALLKNPKTRKTETVSVTSDLQRRFGQAGFPAEPDEINNWYIVWENGEQPDRLAGNLRASLKRVAEQQGIFDRFKKPPQRLIIDLVHGKREYECWEEQIKKLILAVKNIDLLVVLLPGERKKYSTVVYNRVKRLCSCTFAVPVQCIRPRTVEGKVDQACRHMLRQIMVKKRATLWRIPLKNILSQGMYERLFGNKATMFVGIDVNHDWKSDMSTVGICCSYDKHVSRFLSYVAYQESRQEMVRDMKDIMIQAFKDFLQRVEILPDTVFVYRDGVTESQLEETLEWEVAELAEACKSVSVYQEGYDPAIEYIVVQKNVSARFVSEDFKSVAPGTVVDTVVVSDCFWDFYLIPHKPPRPMYGVHKTATPTRYIVLRDDLQMTSNELQSLSLHLCSMYFNWAGPIRVPACVKYADKLAYLFGSAIQTDVPHEDVRDCLFQL
eukprot:103732_1